MLNIVNVFNQATPAELAEGREWYAQANALADELVRDYGTGVGFTHQAAVRTAAGVIAAISPRLSWSKNVELAHWLYGQVNRAKAEPSPAWLVREQGSVIDRFPGLKANGLKAIRILMGDDPSEVLGGPKVTAFYRGIVDPFDPLSVCVDRHAFDIAVGRVMDDPSRGKVLGRKGAYERFVGAYRRAADKLSSQGDVWTPAQVQAVTWVTWRRLKKEGKV
jgi:hypothetical protein